MYISELLCGEERKYSEGEKIKSCPKVQIEEESRGKQTKVAII